MITQTKEIGEIIDAHPDRFLSDQGNVYGPRLRAIKYGLESGDTLPEVYAYEIIDEDSSLNGRLVLASGVHTTRAHAELYSKLGKPVKTRVLGKVPLSEVPNLYEHDLLKKVTDINEDNSEDAENELRMRMKNEFYRTTEGRN